MKKKWQSTCFLKKNRGNLLLIFLLFLVVWAFFSWRVYQVDGDSMLPALKDRERYIVHKTSTIRRYDIVSFHKEDTQYVKRIIGLPGDKLFVVEGRIYLRPLEAGAIPSQGETGSWDSTLCVHAEIDVLQRLADLTEIPDNQYFVLGDNRQASKDSRSLGLITAAELEGTAFFRYYPLNRIGFLK